MKVAKTDLVRALQLRYDHYSAQGVFEAACAKAGLDDEQAHFDRAQIAAFRTALARVGDRLQRVDERLDDLLGEGAPAQAPQATAPPAPPAKPEPEPERAAQAPQATTPPPPVEIKAESKPAEKTEAKTVEKPVEKAEAKPTKAKTTRIVLKDLELAKGEQLLVCGDLPELGNWDPERARPMAKDGDVYTTTIELSNGDAGAFKFLRRTADGTFKWEGGENRDLDPAAKIEASWQS